MNKFIKEYLYSVLDNSLIGKHGFFADSVDDMMDVVNNCKLKVYDKFDCPGMFPDYPFRPLCINKSFKLFYHDPYYDLKMAVEKEGETLEVNLYGVWTEITDLESFFTYYPNPYPPEQYRTELNRRIVTNRELDKWLATRHGQVRSSSTGRISSSYGLEDGYHDNYDNKPVEDVLVRTWDDVAWHLPTASYLGLNQ